MSNLLINKKCLFRTFSAGVHYGTLLEKDGRECLLANSRRIWQWAGAFTLSEISQTGLGKDSKLSVEIPVILLTEVIEIMPCSDEASKNLETLPAQKI